MEIGKEFQKQTKYYPDKPIITYNIPKPSIYKCYKKMPRINLAKDINIEKLKSLEYYLTHRKSVRKYKNEKVEFEKFSFLLKMACGIAASTEKRKFRAAPSAGATYPIETYVLTGNVEDIEPGIYHYNIYENTLELIKSGDFREELCVACLNQDMLRQAAFTVIWSSIFDRCKYRYFDRAYRYVYLDAGHIAQTFALTAVALGLATCQVGAFFDDNVNALLGLDGEKESVIYMSTAGTESGYISENRSRLRFRASPALCVPSTELSS